MRPHTQRAFKHYYDVNMFEDPSNLFVGERSVECNFQCSNRETLFSQVPGDPSDCPGCAAEGDNCDFGVFESVRDNAIIVPTRDLGEALSDLREGFWHHSHPFLLLSLELEVIVGQCECPKGDRILGIDFQARLSGWQKLVDRVVFKQG